MIVALLDHASAEGVVIDLDCGQGGVTWVRPYLVQGEVEFRPASAVCPPDLALRVLGGQLTTRTYPG